MGASFSALYKNGATASRMTLLYCARLRDLPVQKSQTRPTWSGLLLHAVHASNSHSANGAPVRPSAGHRHLYAGRAPATLAFPRKHSATNAVLLLEISADLCQWLNLRPLSASKTAPSTGPNRQSLAL